MHKADTKDIARETAEKMVKKGKCLWKRSKIVYWLY